MKKYLTGITTPRINGKRRRITITRRMVGSSSTIRFIKSQRDVREAS